VIKILVKDMPLIKKAVLISRIPLLALSGYLGISGMLASYDLARAAGSANSVSIYFWASYFILTLPLLFLTLSPVSKFWTRVVSLSGLAFVSALPKIFRSLSEPLYAAEYGNLKSVNDILMSGVSHWWNGLPISPTDFPVFPLVSAFIIETTGIDIWVAVNIILIIVHILTLLGLFLLLRVKLSPRAAAVGSILYAANPNWMFYSNQFDYETFSLMLFFWLLFFVVKGLESPMGQRIVTLAISGPILFLLSATHPVTFVVAILVILLYLSITFFNNIQDPLIRLGSLATTIWLTIWSIPSFIINYESISYYFIETAKGINNDSLPSLLNPSMGESKNNLVNSYSSLPFIETLTVILTPIVLISVTLFYIIQRNHLLKQDKLKVEKYGTLSILGLFLAACYFLSFVLIPMGVFGLMKISWTYTFIGFSIMAGLIYESYLLSYKKYERARPPNWKIYNSIIAVVFTILSISSITLGTTAVTHYPESNVKVASDPAKWSESLVVAEWVEENLPRNTWVLTDIYTGKAMYYPGGVQVAPLDRVQFPYWKIFLNPNTPPINVMRSAEALGVEYLVVNKRIFSPGTSSGYWFSSFEIEDYENSEYSMQNTDIASSIGRQPWTETIWANESYVVYKIIWQQYRDSK
jgi:hypothetical protein